MEHIAKRHCPRCTSYSDCLYRIRNLEQKCPQLRDITKGYEYAEKDANERIKRGIAWLKAHANDYIVDMTPTYPDAPQNLIIGGRCWKKLEKILKTD